MISGRAGLVAVTGGTGFLGRYCVAALVRAGWRVRLLVRHDPAHPMLDGLELDLIPGDLDDAPALTALVRDADAVLHIAGLVKARTPGAFDAINRAGTARLAAIVAHTAPTARFVLISSQVAREPSLSAYAASKHAAEQAALSTLADSLILRPCVVYGPWDLEGIAILRLARQRIVPVPALPEPRLAMIHATDAADAIATLTAATLTGTYEINDGAAQGHGWRDIIRSAGAATPHFLPLPDTLIRAAGCLSGAWAALRGQPAIFGPGKAREILHRDWRPDPALRLPPSQWSPRVGLRDGMRDTLAWWNAGLA